MNLATHVNDWYQRKLADRGFGSQLIRKLLGLWANLVSSLNAWYQNKIVEKSFSGQLLRKSRRAWIGTFTPGYIQKSINETRQGDCHRCGLCCQLVYKCPFLGRDAQNLPYCRVYGDLRPANCRNYPFDAVDSEIEGCGYTFKPGKKKA